MRTISKHNFIGYCELCGQRRGVRDITFIGEDANLITLAACQQCNKKIDFFKNGMGMLMYEVENDKYCEICGRAFEYLLEVTIPDRDEDGDISLSICRDCSDSILDFIAERRYNAIKDLVGDEAEARQIQEMLSIPDIAATVEVFDVAIGDGA